MAAHRTDRGRRVAARDRGTDRGFTLVEILIVIVILGVLATVTVFAVSGIKDKGDQSTCAAERKTMETALSTYAAQQPSGAVATETELVAKGFLHSESELFDVDNSGSLVPQSGASVSWS